MEWKVVGRPWGDANLGQRRSGMCGVHQTEIYAFFEVCSSTINVLFLSNRLVTPAALCLNCVVSDRRQSLACEGGLKSCTVYDVSHDEVTSNSKIIS